MATSISKKFLPPKNVFDSLPIREQEQLPLIIGSNLVFMLMFTLFGIALFIFGFPLIGGGAVFLLAFFWRVACLYKTGACSQRSLAHNNCNCHHYCA